MPRRKRAQISSRKQPQQERSSELVRAILEAAVQVLAKEGAARFTTARVAVKAGVSVGSIYQYFPNKASILFRLQSDEWRETTDLMRSILQDAGSPPLDRLRMLVHAFFKSECDEAAVRGALNDAAPLYRDAPEAAEAMEDWDSITDTFMREALPGRAKAVRDLAGDLIATTLTRLRQGLLRNPAHAGGDQGPCRRHGRYVHRLPAIALAKRHAEGCLALPAWRRHRALRRSASSSRNSRSSTLAARGAGRRAQPTAGVEPECGVE